MIGAFFMLISEYAKKCIKISKKRKQIQLNTYL